MEFIIFVASYLNLLETSYMAPAHLHATKVAVHPSLFTVSYSLACKGIFWSAAPPPGTVAMCKACSILFKFVGWFENWVISFSNLFLRQPLGPNLQTGSFLSKDRIDPAHFQIKQSPNQTDIKNMESKRNSLAALENRERERDSTC